MPRMSPRASLVAAVSLVAGVVTGPTVAYAADTTTALSAAEMSAALKAAEPASSKAAAGGWRATMALTESGQSGSLSYVVDPSGGVMFDQLRIGELVATEYAVGGKGRYEYTDDPTSRAAVKMMGRPSVRYVFTPDKSLNLAAYVKENAPSPATILTEDDSHTGTKTTHDDQSVDYRFNDGQGEVVTVNIGPDGVVTGAHIVSDDLDAALAYTYAAQHVTLPAASVTINSTVLAEGVAYLSMPDSVKDVANRSARDARRAAHGRRVNVASLRKVVRSDVSLFNVADQVKMIMPKSVGGGMLVSATNPWTHQKVSYTVKASGTKVVVKRA
jgi:hypothetical protein